MSFTLAAALQPCYTLVLIALPLSSILVPILCLILFFSTPNSRRTLLFALNVLIVLLGIVEGVLNTLVQSIIILHPEQYVSNGLFITYVTFAFCTPIVVDSVLILRLSSVYPATLTPSTRRFAILSVPLLCSAARFVCVSVFVHQWAVSGPSSLALLAGPRVWPRNPMVIADWSIQLFENFYCSALFLFRLRGQRAISSRMYRNQTIATRLRAVFYIAVSNFVFPTFFNIVQLVFIIHDPSVIHGAIVLTVSNYVSIIGVLFSTLWCSSYIWKGTHNDAPLFQPETGFIFPQSLVTLSGISPNLTPPPPESRPQGPFSHIFSTSFSRGHRPRPATDVSRPYSPEDLKQIEEDLALDASSASKECNAASFLQPIALPRAGRPSDESDCPSRSPITPRDSGPSSEGNRPVKNWAREPHCEADEEDGRASALSEIDSDVDRPEIAFATPIPPTPRRTFWRHQRRHSLSASMGTPEPDDVFYAPALRETVSEDNHPVRVFMHPEYPPVSRTQAPRASWSDADQGQPRRTPSWDERPP